MGLCAAGIPYRDALELPYTLARDLAAASAEGRRAELHELSLALRAAQADAKGWKAWERALGVRAP